MREETALTKVRLFSLQPATLSRNPITLLMIRNFQLFCNLNRVKHSDFLLLQDSLASLNPSTLICPVCGASHCCTLHAHYFRDFICISGNSARIYSVKIPRIICSSCHQTHAFLPACLIPHASYSLFFILTVLRSYFLRSNTVDQLCNRFSISISTLYSWLKLFSLHKELWLGVLKNAAASPLDFLAFLFDHSDFLLSFFMQFRFSFLQQHRATTNSHPT